MAKVGQISKTIKAQEKSSEFSFDVYQGSHSDPAIRRGVLVVATSTCHRLDFDVIVCSGARSKFA